MYKVENKKFRLLDLTLEKKLLPFLVDIFNKLQRKMGLEEIMWTTLPKLPR